MCGGGVNYFQVHQDSTNLSIRYLKKKKFSINFTNCHFESYMILYLFKRKKEEIKKEIVQNNLLVAL